MGLVMLEISICSIRRVTNQSTKALDGIWNFEHDKKYCFSNTVSKLQKHSVLIDREFSSGELVLFETKVMTKCIDY